MLGFPPSALVVPIQELIYGQMWRKDPSRSRKHCEVCRPWGGNGEAPRNRDKCKGKNGHCALLKGEKHDFLVPDERKGNINKK